MPVSYVDISAEPSTAWTEALEGVAGVIDANVKPNVTGVRIYPYWVYEIDPESMLGKVTAPMIATSGTSEGAAHCWTLGISEVNFVANAQGEPDVMGDEGRRMEWRLVLDVWGFRKFDGTRATQQAFINEARLVAMAMRRNATALLTGIDRVSYVSPLRYTSLQPAPFSDGSQLGVAAGVMEVRVKDSVS